MRPRRLARYYGGAAAPAPASAPYTLPARYSPLPARSQYVGMNLNTVNYSNTNLPFSDAMKQSSGFYWAGAPTGGAPLALDADGWPTSLSAGQNARTNVLWGGVSYPAGQYVILWDGEGTISFPLSNVSVNSSVPGRVTMTPTRTDTAIYLQINTINAANPIRNIRFLLPGTESTYATQPFNPTFLDRIAPFSVLRFMDWGQVNGSSLVNWSDRRKTSSASYGSGVGVPYEVMIDLANRMHAHPWICIPHQATDDFVTQLATLLHANLDPTLRPRIEFSNEMWNTGFSQINYGRAQSVALNLAQPWGTPSLWYAKRAVECFNLMRGVYGADSGRLMRIFGGQAVWTQFLDNATTYSTAPGNFDAIAIAPYVQAKDLGNPANLPGSLSTTPDQVVDQMYACMNSETVTSISSHSAMATRLGVSMVGYEAGKSNTSNYAPFTSDQIDAIAAIYEAGYRNPRMVQFFVDYYTLWKSAGNTGALNQFTDIGPWSKFGAWAALESLAQDPATAPNYQGLLNFIAANP